MAPSLRLIIIDDILLIIGTNGVKVVAYINTFVILVSRTFPSVKDEIMDGTLGKIRI